MEQIIANLPWQEVLTTAVVGIGYAISGYANRKGNEKWHWNKFGKTVVFAALIGGIAGYVGKDYSVFANSGIAATITIVAEKAWKAIMNKIE